MTDQPDILGQLADDARRHRVARILPDGELDWDWIKRIQSDFNTFVEKHSLSLNDISRRMGRGFSPAMLSGFRLVKTQDGYVGDIQRLARGLNQFMETFLRSLDAPRPKGWVETEVARRMLSLIKNAIEFRSIGLIYSDAGRGKTMTLQAASQIYSQAILIRVRRSTRTPNGIARQLCEALRIRAATMFEREEMLINALKGSDRPILVDEAHQLEMPALELLRDLHDECGIPIILAGTHQIYERCNDEDEFFGQFMRRISLHYDVTEEARGDGRRAPRPLHTVAEIRKLWQSDKLRLTDDGAEMLARIANVLGAGGLGRCHQILFVASRLPSVDQIDAKTVLRVLTSMKGVDVNKRLMNQIDRPAAKRAAS